jgi:hypothetical protein
MTIDINEAVRTYLGSGSTGGVLPYGMEERVRAKYGADAAKVMNEVELVMGMVDGMLDDRERCESLQTIGTLVAERVHARRPDLHENVCRAIGNYVSYNYR